VTKISVMVKFTLYLVET